MYIIIINFCVFISKIHDDFRVTGTFMPIHNFTWLYYNNDWFITKRKKKKII